MTTECLPFMNPATGEQFGQVAVTSFEAAQNAVSDMRQASREWGRRPVAERVRLLRQLQAVLIDARDEISATITQDTAALRPPALAKGGHQVTADQH